MSLKSWGFELWDQVDRIIFYTGQGLEQLELFYKTVSDIQKIYLSLVKKYKNLSIVPANKVKLVLENSTYFASLNKIFQTFNEQASVYEAQAEDLRTSVLLPIKTFLDNSKIVVSDQKNEFSKFKQKVEKQKTNLDAAWSRYFNAYVTKKRAEAAYIRVKDDKTLPRVEIEKLQGIASQKENDLEKIKGDYASCLQQFNKDRSALFLKDLPKICSEMEMLDRQRAELTIEAGLSLVKIQQLNLDKTGVCNVAFGDAIRLIDFKADSKCFVDTYKTTLLMPADIVFVDLMKCRGDTFNVGDFPGLLQQGGKIEKNDAPKSLFAAAGLRGIELKDMLPEQVKQRLDDISYIIPNLEKELAGLKTLFETYKKDPNMGDKAKLEPQIDTIERKLLSLREMQETISNKSPAGRLSGGPSVGGGSATSLTVTTQANKVNVTMPSTSDDDGSFDDDEEEDFDTQDTVAPNTRMATVLYRFDATDSQQMTVDVDQKVKVVNYDDGGTGWTLVQHMDNALCKGYVPTNYINLH